MGAQNSVDAHASEYLVDKSILDAIQKQRLGYASAAAMLAGLSDYELVIRVNKELEGLFKREFKVQGCQGLHECINAVQQRPGLENIFHQTDGTIVRDLRYLATIRNKMVHEQGFFHIPDRERYLDTFERSCQQLSEIIHQQRLQHSSNNEEYSHQENNFNNEVYFKNKESPVNTTLSTVGFVAVAMLAVGVALINKPEGGPDEGGPGQNKKGKAKNGDSYR